MNERHIQQGDVLFFRTTEELPSNLVKVKPIFKGLTTFAEGETTGHHHSADASGVDLLEDPKTGQRWASVTKRSTVTHQEHGPITLKPGVYQIGIVVEVDPFEDVIREVRD